MDSGELIPGGLPLKPAAWIVIVEMFRKLRIGKLFYDARGDAFAQTGFEFGDLLPFRFNQWSDLVIACVCSAVRFAVRVGSVACVVRERK